MPASTAGLLGIRGGVMPGIPIGMLIFGRDSLPGSGRAGDAGSETSGGSLEPLPKTLPLLPRSDGGLPPGAIIAGEKLRPAARAATPPLLGVGRERGSGAPAPGGGVCCCSNMAAIAFALLPARTGLEGVSDTSGGGSGI